jgi:hypothetical protein
VPALASEYVEAKSLHRRALAIREQALELGHPSVAISLSKLAGLLDKQAKHDEAATLRQRVSAIEKGGGASR